MAGQLVTDGWAAGGCLESMNVAHLRNYEELFINRHVIWWPYGACLRSYCAVYTRGPYCAVYTRGPWCIRWEVADAYQYLTTGPPRGTDRTGGMLLIPVL